MPLEDYREHFEGWLKDLKKTGGYWPIVERHDYNWSNIYSDLNRLTRFGIRSWNREQENGTNMVYLVLQKTDVQIIFHCFETQNSAWAK